MKITPLISQLRDHCPTLANRVAAGIDLATLQASNPLQTPCAYVVPIADLANKSVAQNLNLQPIRDRFEVTLVLDTTDATKALDLMHDLRAELWRALVGFKPGSDYDAIAYDGGELVSINSSRALYRLRFFTEFQLGRNLPGQPAESWHERELDGLSSFTGVTVRVDAIDPADPNLKRPGPDGRLELTFSGDVTP
ncbi:phage tail terminator protein [Pseudomonas sp.]|uniref:phage tail terminator protein n=1 Tax=Pseudomonas sp. TaxID=306 RepID=UPI003F3F6794